MLTEGGLEAEKAGFLRQRRMLITVSVLLSVYITAGIEIKDTAQVWGGVTVQMESPWVLQIWLIIAWIWALWRYWVYFAVTPTRFASDYGEDKTTLIQRRAERIYLKQFIESRDKGERGHYYESREFNVRLQIPSEWQVILKGRIHYTKADGNRAVAEIDNDEHIVPLWGLGTLASIRVLLKTPYLTEYILPFIIWLLPVGCWLLWGSIRSHLV